MNDLPEGYVIDQAAPSMDLPSGYQLDPAPSQKSSAMPGEELFRQIGLAGRDLAGAIPMGIASLGDLANMGINKVAGTNLGMPSDYVQKALSATGMFPEYRNAVEKGVGTATSMLFSGGENTVPTLKEMGKNASDMFKGSATPTTSAEVKSIASQYYKQAEEAGGTLKPSFTNKFIEKVNSLTPQTEAGKIFAGETPATQIAGRMQALKDQPLSLPALQEIDEHLGNMIDSEYGVTGLSKNGKQLLDLQSNLRNMVKDVSPEHVAGGTEGFDALNNGRKAWAQAAKMRDIEKIQTRALYSENPSQAIKTGVRTLLSNPSRTRGYSLEELSALQKAGNRGVIGSTLNVLGSKLIPIGAGIAGETAGGPLGAAINFGVAEAGTTAARKAASALQGARLQNVLNTLGANVGATLPQTLPATQSAPFSLMSLIPQAGVAANKGGVR